jgi:hypothetical protein
MFFLHFAEKKSDLAVGNKGSKGSHQKTSRRDEGLQPAVLTAENVYSPIIFTLKG